MLSPARAVRRSSRQSRRGFTLLELMVVLLIIGLLMGTAAFAFLNQGENARRRTTMQSMQTIVTAIKQYQMMSGAYPPNIAALVPKYLEETPKDAWKHEFVYFVASDGNSAKPFTLQSMGKTGEQGGPDSIDYHLDKDKILSE